MLGVLCGLESERKIASQIPDARVACAAARPYMARDYAKELVAKGAQRLMSFGIAGALDSSVFLGDIFIGSRVASTKGQWLCDESWGNELAHSLPQAKRGGVFGSEVLVATVEAKESLHQSTGCAIVDMESQCVAEVAGEEGIPFAVVRAVCDNVVMNVPPFVMAAIGSDGRVSGWRAFGHLALHPTQAADLMKVAQGTNQALRALKAAIKALGA